LRRRASFTARCACRRQARSTRGVRATKAKEPNRYLGYAGAAQAAEKAGENAKAKDNYQKLLALAAGTDSQRPELAAAKKYLATN